MSAVADVLRNALARLDGGKKWCQRTTRQGERVCVMFALPEAIVGDAAAKAYDALRSVVASEYPDRTQRPDKYMCIGDFNDSRDTTWADVERVFEKAIANAEAEL